MHIRSLAKIDRSMVRINRMRGSIGDSYTVGNAVVIVLGAKEVGPSILSSNSDRSVQERVLERTSQKISRSRWYQLVQRVVTSQNS